MSATTATPRSRRRSWDRDRSAAREPRLPDARLASIARATSAPGDRRRTLEARHVVVAVHARARGPGGRAPARAVRAVPGEQAFLRDPRSRDLGRDAGRDR